MAIVPLSLSVTTISVFWVVVVISSSFVMVFTSTVCVDLAKVVTGPEPPPNSVLSVLEPSPIPVCKRICTGERMVRVSVPSALRVGVASIPKKVVKYKLGVVAQVEVMLLS